MRVRGLWYHQLPLLSTLWLPPTKLSYQRMVPPDIKRWIQVRIYLSPQINLMQQLKFIPSTSPSLCSSFHYRYFPFYLRGYVRWHWPWSSPLSSISVYDRARELFEDQAGWTEYHNIRRKIHPGEHHLFRWKLKHMLFVSLLLKSYTYIDWYGVFLHILRFDLQWFIRSFSGFIWISLHSHWQDKR